MYKFLSKRGTMIATVVGALLAVAFIVVAFTTVPEGLSADSLKDGAAPKSVSEVKEILSGVTSFDVGFYTTYVFLVLAAAAAILLGLLNFVKNFTMKSLRSMIPIIVLILVFIFIYASYAPETSDVYAVKKVRKTFEVMENDSKIISGGIWTAIFGLGAAFVGLVVAEVVNIFK